MIDVTDPAKGEQLSHLPRIRPSLTAEGSGPLSIVTGIDAGMTGLRRERAG